ncbi:hypothetical protein HRbin15_02304 [bacterium HR15]|nr:hypothetical protein HRbin15_02304 [bacterium HR15]
MREIVVDASVVMKWIISEEHSSEARLLLTSDGSDHEHNLFLIAPDVMLAEVAHGLRRLVSRGVVNPAQAESLFDFVLVHAPVELFGIYGDEQYDPQGSMVRDALQLANRYLCSLYDALYICLALKRSAGFVTADLKLYNKSLPLTAGRSLIWVADLPQWLGTHST